MKTFDGVDDEVYSQMATILDARGFVDYGFFAGRDEQLSAWREATRAAPMLRATLLTEEEKHGCENIIR